MIQTTSTSTPSQEQRSEDIARSLQNEHTIPGIVSCTICDAVYAPSPLHLDLQQAPPQILEAAFMSMCHFCFRCRRPACPACWDTVHGVCGACVQEASLPFREDAEPLHGVLFSPLRQEDTAQENTPPPVLMCVRPGCFQTNVSLSTDPLKALPVAPVQAQWTEEPEERDRPITQTSIVPSPPPEADSNIPEEPGTGMRFIKVIERLMTVILLIILLAVAAMIILAEVSKTANIQILRIFNVNIRYEIAYLISLIQQIHL